jgi:hypothetical protein
MIKAQAPCSAPTSIRRNSQGGLRSGEGWLMTSRGWALELDIVLVNKAILTYFNKSASVNK